MTKGKPAIPRLKNKDIVKAIVIILKRHEEQENNITNFMRCQI